MQKVELTDEQLNNVIRLHKADSKWLAIQKETGISRHIAKREYENWERKQSLGELKGARKDVAAEAFREHVNYLVQVAEMLTNGLREPTVTDRDFNADQLLDEIWKKDIISQSVSSRSPSNNQETHALRNLRQNRMLFQSLVTHTRDSVQWTDLDEWKKNWNGSVNSIRSLREKALKMIDDYLAKEEHTTPSVTANIIKHAQYKQPLERMAGAIIDELLRRLENKVVTKIYSRDEFNVDTQLVFSNSNTIILKFSNDKSATEASRACNSVADELVNNHEKDLIKPLKNSIDMMRKVRGKFEERLHPLLLRPMILRTSCDLCPAPL